MLTAPPVKCRRPAQGSIAVPRWRWMQSHGDSLSRLQLALLARRFSLETAAGAVFLGTAGCLALRRPFGHVRRRARRRHTSCPHSLGLTGLRQLPRSTSAVGLMATPDNQSVTQSASDAVSWATQDDPGTSNGQPQQKDNQSATQVAVESSSSQLQQPKKRGLSGELDPAAPTSPATPFAADESAKPQEKESRPEEATSAAANAVEAPAQPQEQKSKPKEKTLATPPAVEEKAQPRESESQPRETPSATSPLVKEEAQPRESESQPKETASVTPPVVEEQAQPRESEFQSKETPSATPPVAEEQAQPRESESQPKETASATPPVVDEQALPQQSESQPQETPSATPPVVDEQALPQQSESQPKETAWATPPVVDEQALPQQSDSQPKETPSATPSESQPKETASATLPNVDEQALPQQSDSQPKETASATPPVVDEQAQPQELQSPSHEAPTDMSASDPEAPTTDASAATAPAPEQEKTPSDTSANAPDVSLSDAAVSVAASSSDKSDPADATTDGVVSSSFSLNDHMAAAEEQAVEEALAVLEAEDREEELGPPAPAPIPPEERPGYTLPIGEARAQIKETVESHRVAVVVGGTGCGKSTQVPQYILDEAAAYGARANVLVTQPRRMAAVELARRVATERGEQLGTTVGYRIRGEVVPGDYLSFVTAGYLLSWFTAEPESFADVTHLVLDEAHERSADMELLLLLVRLLMRVHNGPRVILMSATIDSAFFNQYFGEFAPPPPIVVGSRLFQVQEFHLDSLANGVVPGNRRVPATVRTNAQRCLTDFEQHLARCESTGLRSSRDIESVFLEFVTGVAEPGTTVLVFIPGYADLCRLHSKLYWNLRGDRDSSSSSSSKVPLRPEQLEEIDEEELDEMEEEGLAVAPPPASTSMPANNDEALAADPLEGRKMNFRIFALHSQVPNEDQEMVLRPPDNDTCHIVLATTIAESSLTLPEVCGVIDFALHRTAYSDPAQPGISTLSTTWCSRASLTQRAGRAGRTRPGWCVRMIPKYFLEGLPEQATPEILRTPLTTLFLKAKGISDGLTRLVEDSPEAQQALNLNASSPAELLAQLPAPPEKAAVASAVQELAVLGVLERASPDADVSVLGAVTLGMPLDVRLNRLLWFGALWGCPAEAVVLAAACSTPNPFDAPSRLAFVDAQEFADRLHKSARSRRYFDGGHFSEPLMLLRLFCSWLRRMDVVAPRTTSHKSAWSKTCNSLMKTEAVDEAKMMRFAHTVSDITLRARDMCSDERGEDACPVRADLHNLVKLLRRPDYSAAEQREHAADTLDNMPRVGEVFRAPAPVLYALLAAAFSDQMFIGSHKYGGGALSAMFEALDELTQTNGVGSEDAVLVPSTVRKRQAHALADEDSVKRTIKAMCGIEPSDAAISDRYVAASFEDAEGFEPEAGPAQYSSDALGYGLPPVERPRVRDLSLPPRLCFMAAGGLRKFTVDGIDLFRAESPYELQFNLAHVSVGKRRLIGIFGEQNPLGHVCHMTPVSQMGEDTFACIAASLTLGNQASEAVRGSGGTLLNPQQLLYTLTTMSLSEETGLAFAFTRGPGGDEEKSRARLFALRLHKFASAVRLSHQITGRVALDQINAVRESLVRALGRSQEDTENASKKVLLWRDGEARKALLSLVELVEGAQPLALNFNDVPVTEDDCVWVKAQPPGAETSVKNKRKRRRKLEVSALRDIVVRESVERSVAKKFAGVNVHSFECPDCGERFKDWEQCMEHYDLTGHLDVSTPEAQEVAKTQSAPVRYRCLHCDAPFYDWESCKAHLEETGHLDWADQRVAMDLCTPPSEPGDERLAPDPEPEALADDIDDAPILEVAEKDTPRPSKRRRLPLPSSSSIPSLPEGMIPMAELNNEVMRRLMRPLMKGEVSYRTFSQDGTFVSTVSLKFAKKSPEVVAGVLHKDEGLDKLIAGFTGWPRDSKKAADQLAAAVALELMGGVTDKDQRPPSLHAAIQTLNDLVAEANGMDPSAEEEPVQYIVQPVRGGTKKCRAIFSWRGNDLSIVGQECPSEKLAKISSALVALRQLREKPPAPKEAPEPNETPVVESAEAPEISDADTEPAPSQSSDQSAPDAMQPSADASSAGGSRRSRSKANGKGSRPRPKKGVGANDSIDESPPSDSDLEFVPTDANGNSLLQGLNPKTSKAKLRALLALELQAAPGDIRIEYETSGEFPSVEGKVLVSCAEKGFSDQFIGPTSANKKEAQQQVALAAVRALIERFAKKSDTSDEEVF